MIHLELRTYRADKRLRGFLFNIFAMSFLLYELRLSHILSGINKNNTFEFEGVVDNFIHYFVLFSGVERRVASQQNIENYSTRPDITFFIIIAFNDFGSDIEEAADQTVHFLVGRHFDS